MRQTYDPRLECRRDDNDVYEVLCVKIDPENRALTVRAQVQPQQNTENNVIGFFISKIAGNSDFGTYERTDLVEL